jgi:glycerol kinase
VPADLLLAIDQGTTSTRAIAFDLGLRPVAAASVPVATIHPRPGWVEADPDAILQSVVDSVAVVLAEVGGPGRIAAAGLANQGETVIAWDAEGGGALSPAVVWQCRRSLPVVERMRAAGLEPQIRARTGLPLDPYYSAGKMTWLLEEVPSVADAAARSTLRMGTVDAWITARLGGPPRTDPSTASRTQLFDLASRRWDPDLLSWFGVPVDVLPAIGASAGDLGKLSHERWSGSLPLAALACDQQAALAGHGAFEPGSMKATYGTGVFALANLGQRSSGAVSADVETSFAWSLPDGSAPLVAQAGFLTAGAFIDWLRDDLGLVSSPVELAKLASGASASATVRVLPALSGLTGPWWRPDAHAVVAGLTAATGRGELARAVLDGIANGVADAVDAIEALLPSRPACLRVDGGLTSNDYLMQRQADVLGIDIGIASVEESTALGIAALAGIGVGAVSREAVAAANPIRTVISPALGEAARQDERRSWRRFVSVAIQL